MCVCVRVQTGVLHWPIRVGGALEGRVPDTPHQAADVDEQAVRPAQQALQPELLRDQERADRVGGKHVQHVLGGQVLEGLPGPVDAGIVD